MQVLIGLFFSFVVLVSGCELSIDSGAMEEETTHAAEGQAEPPEGPHGGRLLRDGNFVLEVAIFETGVPPEFRIYPYLNGRPLPPAKVSLMIELARLGGDVDRFSFSPQGDYLVGNGQVREPHSFDVSVRAEHADQNSSWAYESYEGRTTIAPAAAKAANIGVERAGSATIRQTLALTGSVRVIPEQLAHVRARYPGVIRSVEVNLNDVVKGGDTLATVQSNESLQTYPITAPVDGIVLEREAVAGEASGAEPLFVVANLSQVWAELDVFARDMARVKAGQPVRIESLDRDRVTEGHIQMLSPTASAISQSVRARVVLDNTNGNWPPGQFVRGLVTVAEKKVPLAVKRAAIQQYRDFQVVFARVGDAYEVRMLKLAKQGGKYVEVLEGIEPGDLYVAENSYLVKADIEKFGATHDH
jgi:membrane fusion protein, heavy metal efflux system